MRTPKVELLLGYKGIDYYTAMVVLYEIGDINRFRSTRKLAGLAYVQAPTSLKNVVGGADYKAGVTSGFVGL